MTVPYHCEVPASEIPSGKDSKQSAVKELKATDCKPAVKETKAITANAVRQVSAAKPKDTTANVVRSVSAHKPKDTTANAVRSVSAHKPKPTTANAVRFVETPNTKPETI